MSKLSVHAAACGFARQVPALHLYAEYCASAESGLRSKALAAIERFMSAMEAATNAERSSTTTALCRVLERFGFRRELVPHPLKVRFLEPALQEMQPQDATVLRWRGQLTQNCELLQAAWELDHSSESASALLERLIEIVDYSGHELPHGLLVKADEFDGDLREMSELRPHVRDSQLVERSTRLIERMRPLFADWKSEHSS